MLIESKRIADFLSTHSCHIINEGQTLEDKDTCYGYSDKGMPYDFFCNVGYCWNIKKFKDMTYDDFTKFVEASLARQLRKLDGSIGTDNRFYDVLWLASKEPETKWNLEF